jgi:drug efflux transport system permease protein
VQVILDGTNSNTALIALGYVPSVARDFATEHQRERIARRAPLLLASVPDVVLEDRPWFNEGLSSRWFLVPSLLGGIILVTVIQLTAFAVVRERELGTIEQVMVTPITRTEFILGKTVPFFLVGLADTALLLLVAQVVFAIPFRGNLAVVLLGASLFLLSTLAIGLLISTSAHTQQQAMVTGFFLHHAVLYSLRLRNAGRQHAARAPVCRIRESAVSLFDRAARRVPQGRGVRGAVAAHGGDGGDRSAAARIYDHPVP